MLRVNRIGVVLIEPYDRFINASTFEKLANRILKMLKGRMHDLYEPSGNYKYSISEREIEKAALGLNLTQIAFKYLNDYYKDGFRIEFKPKEDKLLNKIRKQILLRDILWKLRLFLPTYLIAVLFKKLIEPQRLLENGYKIKELTKDPYL